MNMSAPVPFPDNPVPAHEDDFLIFLEPDDDPDEIDVDLADRPLLVAEHVAAATCGGPPFRPGRST